MDKNTTSKQPRDRPSDLDGPGFSDKSYRPGYDLGKSLQDKSEEDLKRGYSKGG